MKEPQRKGKKTELIYMYLHFVLLYTLFMQRGQDAETKNDEHLYLDIPQEMESNIHVL
uniref:Uncharacterized protein n=1 Tax=Sphaeramia orbicularis TaxID=375764 RepID=A0A672YI80_9TELE